MAKSTRQPPSADSQSTRRVKYGLNVAIAIAAAVAIVVLIDVLCFGYLEKMRVDATHSRLYSLSDQTRKILKDLKRDYRIVTLIVRSNEYFENARDLIAEYASYSGRVTVEDLDPTASRGQAFFTTLMDRYEKQLAPVRDAIELGRSTLTKAREGIPACAEGLTRALQNDELQDEQQKKFLRAVSNFLARFGQETGQIEEVVADRLKMPMPDLAGLLNTVKTPLEELVGALDQSVEKFETWGHDVATPASAKEQVLATAASFKQLREQVNASLEALRKEHDTAEYDKVRGQLTEQANTVAVLGEHEVRVIPLNDMFRRPDPDQAGGADEGPTVDWAFIGEEQITGALVGMEMEKKPLVVFVSPGQERATGPGGNYQLVADRLATMNFEVQEWNTTMRQNQFGGPPMPPGPPPEPKAGQKAVWIVPPVPGPNPMMGQAGMGEQQVPDTVRTQLEKGAGALVMFSPNPMSFGGADPMADVVAPWGVRSKTDRRILREVQLPDQRTVPDYRMVVTDWAGDGLAITAALAGMPAVFPLACPLDQESAEGKTYRHWVLARATGRRLWAQTDLHSRTPQYDPATADDSFTIAVAAEKDKTRLVVVGDPMWATDEITTNADQYLRAPKLAHMLGAAYPANAELFVNAVLWLADLDQLIARSARSQDIRRIASMSDAQLITIRWLLLAGLPVLALGAGLGVWGVRRRV